MAAQQDGSELLGMRLNEERFVELLGKMVGEGEQLQNWPAGGYVPREDLAARHLLALLKPFSEAEGGPLKVEHIHLDPEGSRDRGNIIVEYPATASNDRVVSFVGSHLDVVFANRDNWDKDPFQMTLENDVLYGRGTTDCLGHCALLADIFLQLAASKADLGGLKVIGVIICDEEAGGGGPVAVGVDGLHAKGYLERLANGPVFWLDCADKQPNIGSGGVVQWKLTGVGKMSHSGFPHKAINAAEFVNDALQEVQKAFYAAFPEHAKEKKYGFDCNSSLKPTRVSLPDGSLNQVPGSCVIEGDIRLIPFYKIRDAMSVVEKAVAAINTEAGLRALEDRVKSFRGPDSHYQLFDEDGALALKAELKLEWGGDPIQGIACDLESVGYKCLAEATKAIIGHVEPIADTGSLPLVADLQDAGLDVQTIGYGVEDAYHADNEFARLSDFKEGFRVLLQVIAALTKK